MGVRAWRVHDTGLVAAPGRFRRLPGRVRHHRGAGPEWPREVDLAVEGDELVVRGAGGDGSVVGRWPRHQVTARRTTAGPPVHVVLEVPGAAHLLALPAGSEAEALLAALAP